MEQTVELRRRWPGTGAIRALNTRLHAPALQAFAVVVLSHWLEHLVQAFQIWVLDMPRREAGGLLGYVFPVLVTEEWLHYGYAAAMLAGLVLLMPGFTGRARTWWAAALAIQVWHHFEHLLLFFQAQTGTALFGREVPTSVLQLAFQRAELHLWYNAAVFVPMVVALYLHLRPPAGERRTATSGAVACGCARA
jgi:hypothetical protein